MAVFVDGNGYEPRWARKSAVFLATDGKMSAPARKEGFFMARVWDICYICMI